MVDRPVATDESFYWERRRDITVAPTTESDLASRADPGDRHLVLLADLDESGATHALKPHLQTLDEFECFTAVPPRYLHVTVTVVGDVVADPSGPDDLSPAALPSLVERLRSALAGVESFDIELPKCNLFPTVVYAEVDDDGAFATLNDRVCRLDGVPVHDRDREGFIPHVALGHFTRTAGCDRVVSFLEANRALSASTVEVDAIDLVALDRSTTRFPAFDLVERFPLA
ncbi:MAG: 2'-5' RNA ligase family protein [Halanaeroarchaeum sp.]